MTYDKENYGYNNFFSRINICSLELMYVNSLHNKMIYNLRIRNIILIG